MSLRDLQDHICKGRKEITEKAKEAAQKAVTGVVRAMSAPSGEKTQAADKEVQTERYDLFGTDLVQEKREKKFPTILMIRIFLPMSWLPGK